MEDDGPDTGGLKVLYVDLHVHLGRTGDGRPVKIPASRALHLEGIIAEAGKRKGIDVVGVVDAQVPGFRRDVEGLLASGRLRELPGGGYVTLEGVTVIPAMEVEAGNGGAAHFVAYFPDLDRLARFAGATGVRNLHLSTQRSPLRPRELLEAALTEGGILVPAHAFTPHKGVYGSATHRLESLFGNGSLKDLPALELGLSADTGMADRISELGGLTFLSNSDAHSPGTIGREYNIIAAGSPGYEEVVKALHRREGRGVLANYGFDPRLGKYHRTFCSACEHTALGAPPRLRCERCGSERVAIGVLDRVMAIADRSEPVHPPHRPPYRHQVPLAFVPGLGPRTRHRLLTAFGSEMAVLHRASLAELTEVVGDVLAERIMRAREGRLALVAGGGGRYGRVLLEGP